jgi:hypothetical protein
MQIVVRTSPSVREWVMRTVVMAIVALLAVDPVVGQQGGRPVFQFRDVRAGQQIDLAAPAYRDCKPRNGRVECIKYRDKVSDIEAMSVFTFFNSRLESLSLTIDREDYSKLLSSLTAKYGPPCETGFKDFRDGRGGLFTGQINRWCFDSGKLSFFEFGSNGQDSDAIYLDTVWRAPAAKPKVDF